MDQADSSAPSHDWRVRGGRDARSQNNQYVRLGFRRESGRANECDGMDAAAGETKADRDRRNPSFEPPPQIGEDQPRKLSADPRHDRRPTPTRSLGRDPRIGDSACSWWTFGLTRL